MHIAILGRQPLLGMAELEKLYGAANTRWFSDSSALVDGELSVMRLGGTLKTGRVIAELPHGDWRRASMKIVQAYSQAWADLDGKITLGISAYGFDVSPKEVQKTGIVLKQKLKKSGVSLRLVPNAEPALSTATSHHNKLGLSNNKVELLVVRARNGRIVVSESTGAQNITALARRDQERPKRDAFVGMLPPKLAQMMINLAALPVRSPQTIPSQNGFAPGLTGAPAPGQSRAADVLAQEGSEGSSPALEVPSQPSSSRQETKGEEQPTAFPVPGPEKALARNGLLEGRRAVGEHEGIRILDPFCGTGVILQEAALLGYSVYGTDLSDKMIDFSQKNLQWLADSHHVNVDAKLHQGDAMDTKWQPPIDAVACETYLGQPFSAPPSPAKLAEVRKNCDHIISTFLKNIAPQLKTGTPLCVGVPAWRDAAGNFTHLPLVGKLEQLGFVQHEFKNVDKKDLLYYREDQVVARELLVLTKK